MNKKKEKLSIYLTYGIMLSAILIMLLVLASFLFFKNYNLRIGLQLSAYIFGIIAYILLIIRQAIKGINFKIVLYGIILVLLIAVLISYIFM